MRTRKVCRIGLGLVAVLLLSSVAWAQDDGGALQEDRCVVCHVEDDNMPEGHLESDVHLAAGLTCAGCHGGDSTTDDEDAAMSEEAGFIGVPSKREIPEFCGRCHSDIAYMRTYQPRIATDQVAQYFTSDHGIRLREGNRKVADCTSCHTSHAILPANDARSSVYPLNVPSTCNACHGDSGTMEGSGLSTNQFERFAAGVHGIALLEHQDTGAPACNDCHGNHGAMPPGITSVKQVCGSCHVNNERYFTASKMGHAFADEELHGCEECHGNHLIVKTSDDMVGTGDKSVCMDCHEEGDAGYEQAAAIHASLFALSSVYDSAQVATKEVHHAGMDDVDIGFLLQEAHQSLIQARTLVHTFDVEKVDEKTAEGVVKAEEALVLAAAQMHEYSVRRWGLGLATLFITLVAVTLFFKIRQMEA